MQLIRMAVDLLWRNDMTFLQARIVPVTLSVFLTFLIGGPASGQISGDTWFPIGPAPIDGFFAGGVSGRATAIAVNPANADDIWLGTAAGGVWHTLDAGLNWQPESDRQDALAIGAIAVAGCDSSGCARIYVGTGENAIRRDTIYGAGLLMGSVTGGEFPTFGWTHITGSPFDFRFGSINDVVLDPGTSGGGQRIFVTLSSGVTVGAPESTITAPQPSGGYGIYRSDNNGGAWSKLSVSGSNTARPTDLEMHPSNPQILFAGFLGRGVFRSTDGGATWCPLNGGFAQPAGCPNQTLPHLATTTFDHVEIAFAADPQVLYATFGTCPDQLLEDCSPIIYRSGDGGLSWVFRRDATSANPQPRGYSRYTHALAVDPADEDTLFVGGVNLWRSTDGGMTFTTTDFNLAPGPGSGVVHSDHRAVVFHPTSLNRVYTAGDGGFAVSENGGTAWMPRNDDLQITGFHGIGSSPLTPAVVGTSQDNGGQLWNGSRRWKHLPCCGDGGYSFLDFDDVMTVYAASNHGSPTRSLNGGINFSTIASGLPSSEPRLFYAPFVQASSPNGMGEHALYWGGSRLFRSIDNGDSWTAVSPVLATGLEPEIVTEATTSGHIAAGTGVNVISAIGIAPSDPNRVYIGYYGGEVFRSNPAPCVAGSCWSSVDGGLPNTAVTRIAVHPTDPQTAYATFSGFGGFARVWKTTNGGGNWNPVVSGLPPNVPANTVSIEPSFPERLYVGLDSGPEGASLFRSTNGGASWDPWAQGLPNAPVFEISIDETHGRIYTATHGRGAFVLGEPFISNFEGWVDDRIWDIPVYGQNFFPNQSCTMSILQSNGDVCASGSVDVMGGSIETDADGVLETSLANMWGGKKVAWACFNGNCLGGTPISECYDDADSDGDLDPLSTIVVTCGGQIAIGQVVGCPPLDNPPSSVTELDLDGFGGGGGGGGGLEADQGSQPEGLLRLVASIQRRVGTESLCAVAVPYFLGDSDRQVLERARDAVAAKPNCVANGVEAIFDPGDAGPSEDEFARLPRFMLQAPSLTGGQLVTGLHLEPGEGTGGCFRLDGLGVPMVNQIQIVKIALLTPPGGAAGGNLKLVEHTPLGTCAITVPTVAGQSGAELSAAIANAVQAPGIPGPHPHCPSDKNSRDIVDHGGFLISVHASSIEICTDDPNVGFDLRPEELTNVHPIADAGGDRTVAPGAAVTLDGSRSSDPDSTAGTHDDIETFEWFEVSGTPVSLGSGVLVSVPLTAGLHRIRLRTTDKGGLSDIDEATVNVGPGLGTEGRFQWSFHLGSAHPLSSELDDSNADANIYVQLDLGYKLTDNLELKGMLGLAQLSAESSAAVEHPRWLHGSFNLRRDFLTSPGLAPFLQLGPGLYKSKTDDTDFGWNFGLGARLPLSSPFGLEIGADYHQISDDNTSSFFTLQLGVLFR